MVVVFASSCFLFAGDGRLTRGRVLTKFLDLGKEFDQGECFDPSFGSGKEEAQCLDLFLLFDLMRCGEPLKASCPF